MTDVTRILNAIERGDARATDELLPLVYEELRILAAQKLSHESPGQTLQATALVHEAYLRLVGDEPQSWENHGHFFAAAAEAMRRILVDHARCKKSQRRGGNHQRVELESLDSVVSEPPEYLVRLDDALTKLAQEDPELAELVKLRYFAGLTLEQAAEIKGISRRTAGRYWHYARLWLYREVTAGDWLDT
ncbi:sigma-70 family RNA polymerase sigma factor [Anaerobaca lacustris]|uniref:Sigma-70 family RNA polymerase sigma factor n=1 Tax=Anaerobaca lacustris TaxID=3044600 RepID=A0AAW6U4F3_9BACT|nr:sigma-70 family RNA polymerase sigma factor [Sedimentisphaerales bacterium M17dextr]